MSTLKDSCVWITGASSGIGEFLAYELGRRGARVALTARRAPALEAIVQRIKDAGGLAYAFPGDVQRPADLTRIAQQITEQVGPIDTLVANAGSHIESWPLRFDSEEYLSLMQLNYGGMLYTIQSVLPSMRERKRGHIVGVASLSGYRGLPIAAAYGASKAAMINFLESLRFHLEEVGIAVSIVNPGFVRTPLTDKNDFPMPFLMEPDAAARVMADGIERRKYEITFPLPFSLILKLGRIIPFRLYAMFVRLLWNRMPRK
jgi:short-subunit dehydrogenase